MVRPLDNLTEEEFTGKQWTIRAGEKPVRYSGLLTGNGEGTKTGIIAHHAFLMLVDETFGRSRRVLDEIHFLPQNGTGQPLWGMASVVSNCLNAFMKGLNLERTFKKASEGLGFGDSVFFLKASSYCPSKGRDLTKMPSAVYDEGDAKKIFPVWNNAYRAAIKIGELKHLFMTMAFDKGSYNCRAGLKGVVESLGYEFRNVVQKGASRGTRTSFAEEISFCPEQFRSVTGFDDLMADHAALVRQLEKPPEGMHIL